MYVGKVPEGRTEASLADALESVEWCESVPRDAAVFVKPNLTYPSYKPGVTTTPVFIEAVLAALSSRTRRIWVGESNGGYRGWPAEMAFQFHDLPRICARFGATLINLSREPAESIDIQAGKRHLSLDLPRLLTREIETLITLPVPKIHSVTRFSGAVKNQWGCIPNDMRLRYHPFFDDAILDLNRIVHTRLAIMDGTFMLDRSGPMFGVPIRMDTLIVSRDIRAADLAACRVMGIDPLKVHHLHLAETDLANPPEIVPAPPPEPARRFELHRSFRHVLVTVAFKRRWAVRLIWDSKLGDLLHQALYRLRGNETQAEIERLAQEMERLSPSHLPLPATQDQ
ncbi:MAG TPA: DUF362 domain-containing protein [Bryobacteraceae bacterium]|nr:DUF362 domain-containing protein [Bryobacteraceae bacterium]